MMLQPSWEPREAHCLPDHILLEICRLSPEEAGAMSQQLDALRALPQLICTDIYPCPHYELAVTLLATVLGQMRHFQPVHLPFGFGGPIVHSRFWIDQETLDGIAKQIIGLVQHDLKPDAIAQHVEVAISEAVRLGFLTQRRYDAWRPGMPSGSGWRCALMATPYGVTKASMACRDNPEPSVPPGDDSVVIRDAVPQTIRAPLTTHVPQTSSHQCTQTDPVDSPYAWARQADLVKATNQVLGGNTLDKGVLSRACRAGKVQTNGQAGRASRVSVGSFLVWLKRQFSLAFDEQVQVRNAVIGELAKRNL